MVSGPLRALRASKVIVNELRFACNHMERKSNEIIFMKCLEPRCLPTVKIVQSFLKMPGHTCLKRNSSGITQWKAWNVQVITKLFVKVRIWILMPCKQVHNIVLISNTLSYKQVHTFVLKRNILAFLH